jgi:hypothetical protein
MKSSLGFCGGLLLLVGCAGREKEAASPSCPSGQIFDGRYCQMAGGPTTEGGGGGATPAPPVPSPNPTSPTLGPGPLPVAIATCSNPAQPIDVAAAAVTPLVALAQKAMPGAKPVGSPVAAQFQTGQCVELNVNMVPGKCYSVVGSGVPTVQNLDLALVPPGLQIVASSDSSIGPTAVLGESPNCFKWALPTAGTMKLIVSVSAGQGLAAAQVFEK